MNASRPLIWRFFGSYSKDIKPNFMGQVFAVLVAAQTFTDPGEKYPWLMALLIIAGAFYVGWLAIKTKSIFGLVVPLVSLIWLNPLFGGDWFNNIPVFFFSQAALALLFGISAYTFLRGNSSARKPGSNPKQGGATPRKPGNKPTSKKK